MNLLPKDAKARKDVPLYSGVIKYFPQALAAVAELSRIGNDQHNPGKPLHWDRSKSTDELDALSRHLVEAGTVDTDAVRHSTKVAWRALANLEKEIEADAKSRADGAINVVKANGENWRHVDGSWIEWNGGECPVPPDTQILIQMKSGRKTQWPSAASKFYWGDEGGAGDIVAYKVVKPKLADGWIEWKGGERPVAADVVVEYKMRDGAQDSRAWPASRLRWQHDGAAGDIVAYKVVKESPILSAVHDESVSR